jgi:hypothetical protein
MGAMFPNFRILAKRNEFRCIGTLQPTPTSDIYTIEVEHRGSDPRPRVHVLRPELCLAPGRTKLPHVFKGKELCLHLAGEWRPHLKIAEFVVPWISFWLFFYETWLSTGEWLGGGHESVAGKT